MSGSPSRDHFTASQQKNGASTPNINSLRERGISEPRTPYLVWVATPQPLPLRARCYSSETMVQSRKHLANAAPDGDADEPPFDLPQAAPRCRSGRRRAAARSASDAPPFDLPSAPARQPISARALQGSAPAPTSAAALSRRPQPRAARGRRGARRPGAGAGRRRHRQDARADHAHRPHPRARGRALPGQILAVTFTNKAAREMKERIGALVGGAVEGMPWLGTFHSIGVKILRRHAELVGLKSGFTILDTDDQIRLIKQVIEARGPRQGPLAGAPARRPDRQLEEPRPDARQGAARARAFAFADGKGAQLYAAYQKRLKELNAADFGDLLLEMLRLFRREPRRARRLPAPLPLHPGRRVPGHQRRPVPVAAAAGAGLAQHLLRRRRRPVDLRLARRRGRQHPALRGGFPRRHGDPPGAQLPLHRPHPRPPPRASSPHNKGRLGKTLFTDGDTGDQGHRRRRVGRRGGGAHHRRRHRGAAARPASSLDEIAILVRASFQMRAFEDRFVTLGLPYRVIGGPRFYERQEIKDAIAYLEVDAQPGQRPEVRAHRQRAQARPRRHRGEARPRAWPRARRSRCIRPRARSWRPRS